MKENIIEGKIILSGEHSVTYGKPAFVTGINLRLTIHLSDGETAIKDQKLHKAFIYIEDIVINYLQKTHVIKKKPIIYSYESEIPIGRGMGSSAAFCVATAAALLHFYSGRKHDKQVINSLAYQADKYFHGFPSGVDVSASCFGGLIFYRKEFEFLKNISSLNFRIPQQIIENLYLLDSGKPVEDTSEMIKAVGKNYNSNPKKMEDCLNNIEKITKRMVISVVKEDTSMFQNAIAENEKLVEELGIVSTNTKKFIKSLSEFGVGKVTGAGGLKKGSGMIVFYSIHNKFKDYLTAHKISYFTLKQDFDGVITAIY